MPHALTASNSHSSLNTLTVANETEGQGLKGLIATDEIHVDSVDGKSQELIVLRE
jgi:hypothetical protein